MSDIIVLMTYSEAKDVVLKIPDKCLLVILHNMKDSSVN